MTTVQVYRLSADSPPQTKVQIYRLSMVGADTASATKVRVHRLSLSGQAYPDAGPDQSGVEPYATVSLSPSAVTSAAVWSQVSGSAVTLLGSGASRYFTAPPTRQGDTLVFRVTEAGLSDTLQVSVLPHNEWAPIGGVEAPLRMIFVTAAPVGYGLAPYGVSPYGS